MAVYKVLLEKLYTILTLLTMDLFLGRGCCRIEGAKKDPSLKCFTYPTIMTFGTVIPYLKKIQTFRVLLTSAFFTENQQILQYQEIMILIAFEHIIYNSFNFFLSLKVLLINMVGILMMSAKLATIGLLKIKVFWYSLWRHNFCPWRHQKKFITWLKSYYKFGHVTKVW